MTGAPADPWQALRALTPARIALGRTGSSLPTHEVLRLGLAHARARDAVHLPLDVAAVAASLEALGFVTLRLTSAAASREIYLRRPDLGRRLSPASRRSLEKRPPAAVDLAVVVTDGLSAAAIHAHAAPLLAAFLPHSKQAGWTVAPVAVATEGRVALGDEIGALLRARASIVFIGERPGLSSPDSLGIYLTFAPRLGRSDAERNCISNIRAEGLAYAQAAFKLAWLLKEAFRRALTGVALKDESDLLLRGDAEGPPSSPAPLPPLR
ncbi:MAG TPA: ethanolamine ammonia-lyase subunit EutC [Stellaceae bacterium]|nr:ethanolamine ammonia-lyase subunit EutC [Stellaceae bacterium]